MIPLMRIYCKMQKILIKLSVPVIRTDFANGTSSETVLKLDFDACPVQTHGPTHIMKQQIPKSGFTGKYQLSYHNSLEKCDEIEKNSLEKCLILLSRL